MKHSNNQGGSDSSNSILKGIKQKLDIMYLSRTIDLAKNFFSKSFKKQSISADIVKQSNFWVRSTILGLMGSTVFGIGWLAVAKTDEIVTVSGKLEPIGSVQEIQMPLGGIASEILVKDGQEVKTGQILMRLDAETTQQRVSSLIESQKLIRRQLDLKDTELEKNLLAND